MMEVGGEPPGRCQSRFRGLQRGPQRDQPDDRKGLCTPVSEEIARVETIHSAEYYVKPPMGQNPMLGEICTHG